jgi:Protein DA1
MRRQRRWLSGFCLSVLVCFATPAWADADHCAICGSAFGPGQMIYMPTDKVTHEKVFICHACASCPDECYICGLPVRANFIRLPDGRLLCARDGKTAVLEENQARDICGEVVETLDKMFSRFLTLPSTNVEVSLVDRINLYGEFTVVGNDFECPDVLGYIHSLTNHGLFKHSISLMSALPRAEFQATCAHEYSHAWVFENVPAERRKTLSGDAHEGFCELVAFLLMDSLHEEEQKKIMLRNTYTRGQINLFIEAEKKFGFNDVLDWMRWGVSSRLNAANLDDVRNVEMPRPKAGPAAAITFHVEQATPVPDTLLLKGISSLKSRPLALINDQTFAAGESAKVRVGTTNVLVRCLAVGGHSARIQIVDSGREMELQLKAGK